VNNAPCAVGRARPGELLSLVMDGLSGSGLDVRRDEDCRLTIDWPGARCMLAVSDCGRAEWEYCPGPPADPGLAADLATTLLTGCPGPFPRLEGSRERATFRGSVGRELTARGLDVELVVYTDEAAFDAFAEIVATVPGDEDAQVHVADDGGLTWIRDYQAETAAIASGPDFCGSTVDPASVASSVVEAVTRAMSCLRPSQTGRAGHG
jgi:hypothetical protein